MLISTLAFHCHYFLDISRDDHLPDEFSGQILKKAETRQSALTRVHQVKENGRRHLLQLLQDIFSGWESCDLQNKQTDRFMLLK